MQSIMVTLKENIQRDEKGYFAKDENDAPILIDENDIGILVKTHSLQVTQIDQESGLLQTGVVFQCEVYWEQRRTPAPDMVAPTDLVWLMINDQTAQTDEADETDDSDSFDSDEDDIDPDIVDADYEAEDSSMLS